MRNKVLPYNPKLKDYARELRKAGIFSEVLLWNNLKGKALGYEFHRQVPIDEYIVDFLCHELFLIIEIDGSSHHGKYDYDLKRQNKLQNMGLQFLRFTDSDVRKNMSGVLITIKEKIKEIEAN